MTVRSPTLTGCTRRYGNGRRGRGGTSRFGCSKVTGFCITRLSGFSRRRFGSFLCFWCRNGGTGRCQGRRGRRLNGTAFTYARTRYTFYAARRWLHWYRQAVPSLTEIFLTYATKMRLSLRLFFRQTLTKVCRKIN